MASITVKEASIAADALSRWFESQGISPAAAGFVMIHLTARLLVSKSKDLGRLREGIQLHGELLTIEVVEALCNA